MKNSVLIKRIGICALPFIAVPLLYFSAKFILNYITLPPCIYYTTAHIYCPGCGFTRSLEALLRGDILLSLRQNLLLIICIILAALYYIIFLLKAFSVKINSKFLLTARILWAALIFTAVFTIIRNFIPALAPI